MRAAIYARKSTDQSHVSEAQKSVSRQVDQARRYGPACRWWSAISPFTHSSARSRATSRATSFASSDKVATRPGYRVAGIRRWAVTGRVSGRGARGVVGVASFSSPCINRSGVQEGRGVTAEPLALGVPRVAGIRRWAVTGRVSGRGARGVVGVASFSSPCINRSGVQEGRGVTAEPLALGVPRRWPFPPGDCAPAGRGRLPAAGRGRPRWPRRPRRSRAGCPSSVRAVLLPLASATAGSWSGIGRASGTGGASADGLRTGTSWGRSRR